MQGYATDLEKSIAAEDRLIAQCTHVCRYATGAVGGRFMLRPEESAVLGRAMAQRVQSRLVVRVREVAGILKSMALADAGVFAVLGYDQVRAL